MFNLDVVNNETQGCDPNMLRDINREFELAVEENIIKHFDEVDVAEGLTKHGTASDLNLDSGGYLKFQPRFEDCENCENCEIFELCRYDALFREVEGRCGKCPEFNGGVSRCFRLEVHNAKFSRGELNRATSASNDKKMRDAGYSIDECLPF